MTWNLISQSFRVLSKDKQLLVFPFISALAAIMVSAPFLVLALARGTDPATRHFDWTWAAIGFAWHAIASFAVIFFNCALAACAQVRFSGGEPTLADGINRATAKAGHIFLWSLIAATVGMFLRWVDERSGIVGRIVVGILGVGWNMATYLIVPVLVVEDISVIDSIKRSGSLLRKTWGEQLVGGISMGWAFVLLAIPGVLLGVLAVNVQPALLALPLLYFALLAAAMTAVRGIFVMAVYRYATTGVVPDGFASEHFTRNSRL